LENTERQFWTYVVENPAGRFYIGSTQDLQARLSQHNNPEAKSGKYCPKNGPWTLLWKKAFATRGQAMKREKFIKSRKSAAWIKKYLLDGRASPDVHRD